VPIVEQTATRPHSGLLVDRRLDAGEAAALAASRLQPLVGPTGEGATAEACLRAGEAVLGSLPPQRVLPATLLAPRRHAGAREALLHAPVGKNHGCTHVIAARGRYRALLASLPAEELGVGLITRRL
jgi:hypothetical protein